MNKKVVVGIVCGLVAAGAATAAAIIVRRNKKVAEQLVNE